VIIASNTSSISITKLAAATSRADKFIGMHFFNPVPMMALVEIIRGLQTSDATHDAVKAWPWRWARAPSP
jgi:3-hydroxybutyryl-CoA dehydrogenase